MNHSARSFFKVAALAIFATVATLVCRGADVKNEYAVKASFLASYPLYIEWPASAFSSADAPFRIGILGDDPFNHALDTMAGQKIKDRSVAIVYAQTEDELKDCQIVFIRHSEKIKSGQVIKAFAGRPVVLIGETAGFAERGGVINFYLKGSNIAFEINLEAARAKGLKINSQLLNLARIVCDKQESKP